MGDMHTMDVRFLFALCATVAVGCGGACASHEVRATGAPATAPTITAGRHQPPPATPPAEVVGAGVDAKVDAAPPVVPAEPPVPHPGSRFRVVARLNGAPCPASGPVVSLAPTEHVDCDKDLGLEDIGLRVLRSAEDARRLDLIPPPHTDFDATVIVAPVGAVGLHTVPALARVAQGETVLTVRDACEGICGGSSESAQRRSECALSHANDAYVVPRPLHLLRVVREVGPRCPLGLP